MEQIEFEHNGVKYTMTKQEIEAAYRYQQHQIRLEDAERQLNILVFGDDEADPDAPENEQCKTDFVKEYGISYDEAVAKPMLEKYLEKFQNDSDCGVNENEQWQTAICVILKEAEVSCVYRAVTYDDDGAEANAQDFESAEEAIAFAENHRWDAVINRMTDTTVWSI